ncbi:hypothetical protein QR680_019335 [Steinernema hermaphroditum]|uniref:Uncharacterized protein n=1 Tax=Steinernema hermaphroditum TaxID=289476 RepID=A0AA39GPY3_9BILA|nr:hypothetical protein QR680_019335 [Steinernema hermaphroditum]
MSSVRCFEKKYGEVFVQELIYNMSRFFKAFKESVHGFNLVLRAMRQNYGKEVDRGQLLAAWQELQEDHTKKPAAKRWKKYEVNLAFLNEKEAKKVPKPKPVKRKAVKKVSPMAISIQLPPAPSKGCLKRSLEDQEQPAAPSPKVLRWADETASEGGLEVEEEESPEQENVDEERVDILKKFNIAGFFADPQPTVNTPAPQVSGINQYEPAQPFSYHTATTNGMATPYAPARSQQSDPTSHPSSAPLSSPAQQSNGYQTRASTRARVQLRVEDTEKRSSQTSPSYTHDSSFMMRTPTSVGSRPCTPAHNESYNSHEAQLVSISSRPSTPYHQNAGEAAMYDPFGQRSQAAPHAIGPCTYSTRQPLVQSPPINSPYSLHSPQSSRPGTPLMLPAQSATDLSRSTSPMVFSGSSTQMMNMETWGGSNMYQKTSATPTTYYQQGAGYGFYEGSMGFQPSCPSFAPTYTPNAASNWENCERSHTPSLFASPASPRYSPPPPPSPEPENTEDDPYARPVGTPRPEWNADE